MGNLSDISWFRASTWWHYILPPIFPVIYLFLASSESILEMGFGVEMGLYLMTLTCSAAFGYFLNDITDVEEDTLANKKNTAAPFGIMARLGILMLLFLAAFFPWVYIGLQSTTFCTWLGLIILLALYSVPPIRLKKRSLGGIICDALYGHVLPVCITIFCFYEILNPQFYFKKILFVLILFVLLFKGLRNIIVHQINDRKTDRENRIYTFVLSISPLSSLNLLNKFILPFEFFFLILFHLLIIETYWVFPFFLIFFLGMSYAKFSGWKFFNMPQRQLKFKFWYFLNDYYEVYLPLCCLLILAVLKPYLFFIPIIHFILFPKAIIKIKEDISIVSKNIKDVWNSRTD